MLKRHLRRKLQLKRKAEPPPLSPEATQRLVDLTERLRVRVMSVPGLVEELQEILFEVCEAYGHPAPVLSPDEGLLKQVLKTPVTLDSTRTFLQLLGRQFIEQGIEIGREETLREYALEALAGAAEEEGEEIVACSSVPLGQDTQVDADFEDVDFEEA